MANGKVHGENFDSVCNMRDEQVTNLVESVTCKRCLKTFAKSLDKIGGYSFSNSIDEKAFTARATAVLESPETQRAVARFNGDVAQTLKLMQNVADDLARNADPARITRLLQSGYGLTDLVAEILAVPGRIGANLSIRSLIESAQRVERVVEDGLKAVAK